VQKPYLSVQPAQYDKNAFIDFLQTVKEQEICTARDNASFVGTFVKSGKSPEDFIKSYEKPNSYNNALTALKHYCDFLGVTRPNLKPRPRAPTALIIAPKPAEIIDIVRRVADLDVKTYLALCATVGLRPERLRMVKWSQIDFENGLVTINEKHGMKIYRPNPLHADVAKLLREL
jgi:integrase